MLKLLHFLFSLSVTAEVNCLQRSTLSPTVTWMQLGMAHILCLLVSSYQSKLHFPCVYSALMHMCLSPFPSDGLDTTKYSAKKQTSLWRGLTWMEAYPLPLGYSRTKRTFYDRQWLENFTCRWLTNQSWCDGALAVSSGNTTCEHQGLPCLSLKLKQRLHEKMPDLRWDNVDERHCANPALCLQVMLTTFWSSIKWCMTWFSWD